MEKLKKTNNTNQISIHKFEKKVFSFFIWIAFTQKQPISKLILLFFPITLFWVIWNAMHAETNANYEKNVKSVL